MLDSYEQQFGVVCADITNKISRATNTNDRKEAIASIDVLFQEAREIIEQMEATKDEMAVLATVREVVIAIEGL